MLGYLRAYFEVGLFNWKFIPLFWVKFEFGQFSSEIGNRLKKIQKKSINYKKTDLISISLNLLDLI